MNASPLSLGRLSPRFLAVGLACLFSSTAFSAVAFHVDAESAALVGHPAGPFSLHFQLTDGTGAGASSASITNLTFNGGSLLPGATSFGNVTGDLSTSLVLSTAGSFFTELIQPFSAGASLGFDVALTGAAPFGPTPDAFAFAVLDSLLFQIPTTDPLGLSLVSVGVTGSALGLGDVKAYSSSAPVAGVNVRVSQIPTTAVPDGDVLGAFTILLVALAALQRLRFSVIPR